MYMSPKVILIIEDDQVLAKTLTEALEKEGFAVVQAVDGEEGLEKALSGGPKLILLDLLLPKMGGIDLLHKLRRDPRGTEVPVIVLTNAESPDLIAKTLAENTYDYMLKTDWKL